MFLVHPLKLSCRQHNLMTGRKPIPWKFSFYQKADIICLDNQQRLVFNFAVNSDKGYKEFATLRQAQKYIREQL